MNLDFGQNGWNNIFSRWGLLIRIYYWIKEYGYSKVAQDRKIGAALGGIRSATIDRRELGQTVIQRFEGLAEAGIPESDSLRDWELSGIKIGENTDDKGILYVTQVGLEAFPLGKWDNYEWDWYMWG